MNKNYAIVENGFVSNIIVIDSDDVETIQLFQAIEIVDNEFVDIGFPYENGQFINPNPVISQTVEQTLTFDEIQQILAELSANNVTTQV
jgi:hypothetical protein